MRAKIRYRKTLACVLAGLLLVGSAPILASQEQAVEQAATESDDEREDEKTATKPASDEAATSGSPGTAEAANDPAFNTLEDIVRLRSAAALLLVRCQPATDDDRRPLTIAWRNVED